ncbi:MAG: DUF6298 domain-containing protein [Nibricoccus sp.]
MPKKQTRRVAHTWLAATVFATSALAVQVGPPVKSAKDGTLVYEVDSRGDRVPDFSHAGYGGGGVPLPLAPARVVVGPVDGDDGDRIQIALDYVSSLSPDANGLRGAVELAPGRYDIAGQLRMRASGVVLRGSGAGQQGTLLVATGVDRRALILVAGKNDCAPGSPVSLVTEDYVSVGANRLQLDNVAALKVGAQILIERPSPKEWIEQLGLQNSPARTPFQWRPGKENISWERTIIAINGHEITLDAPLTTSLEKRFGGATVTPLSWTGRIENAGVENLRCESSFDAANPKDEQHAWEGVRFESVRDAWVSDVVFVHFAGSVVNVTESASRITVQDCASREPVSEQGGYRRLTFHTSGQQTLFLRCTAEDGRNDFTVGYFASGPNAFVECRAERSSGFSGGIGSWASGALFDNVHIDGGELRLDNLETYNQGVGWAAVNSVIWEASAGRFVVRTPPGANNWAVGVWGLFTGDGSWSRTSEFAEPDSLYRAQLAGRKGAAALKALERGAFGKIAMSSVPSLEKAVSDLSARLASVVERRKTLAPGLQLSPAGWLVANDTLLVGRHSEVAWWRGRLEPNRAAEVGPSLTRFSPGRKGTGLTDDLDELTDRMRATGQVAMRHHYGLWYDRRRDDHQMNKRPDAETWPPFFEQPFLLSGQGEAWNRLSRYDLTRYNPWYFGRLKTFAELGRAKGLVLINEMYFQHNIIESGAHWVDCPWRPVNNINNTGFTEPPPFNGDTIRMAPEFYDVSHPVRGPLHRAYIRQCLANLADEPNVIHTLSEEYTGPLHFMQFWLDVAGEWMRETGKHPLLALSATKDVQDAILADPERAKLISVIDLKYWFRTDRGEEFAPKGGENLAPRQHLRKWKGGRPSAASIASMVREYRAKFPDKAVIAELDEADGWQFVFAGGSLAKLPAGTDPALLAAIAHSRPTPPSAAINASGDAVVLEGERGELIVYLSKGGDFKLPKSAASLKPYTVDLGTGAVRATGSLSTPAGKAAVIWLKLP